MPERYTCGDFLFQLFKKREDGYYYNVTNLRHGMQSAYNMKFNSIAEMNEYASKH